MIMGVFQAFKGSKPSSTTAWLYDWASYFTFQVSVSSAVKEEEEE